MNLAITIILLIAGLILLLVIGILFFKRIDKKNKQIKLNIPEDVLKDFEKIEKEVKNSNGEIDPYAILWGLSRNRSPSNEETSRRDAESDRFADRGEIETIKRALDRQPEGRQDLPLPPSPTAGQDSRKPQQPKPNNSRRDESPFERLRRSRRE